MHGVVNLKEPEENRVDEERKPNRLVSFINEKIKPLLSHALIAIFIGILVRIFVGEGEAGLGILLIWFFLLMISSIPYGFGVVPVLNKKVESGRFSRLFYLYMIFFLIAFLGYNP